MPPCMALTRNIQCVCVLYKFKDGSGSGSGRIYAGFNFGSQFSPMNLPVRIPKILRVWGGFLNSPVELHQARNIQPTRSPPSNPKYISLKSLSFNPHSIIRSTLGPSRLNHPAAARPHQRTAQAVRRSPARSHPVPHERSGARHGRLAGLGSQC
jgi:hypothetical protein